MWKDILFLLIIMCIVMMIIAFLKRPLVSGYRRAMIERMTSMDESPSSRNKTEAVDLEEYPSRYPHQKPYVGMYKVHMLGVNNAQHGRDHAVYVPLEGGLPMSALPNLSVKQPWALADIEAAQVPEREECERSVTGLFYSCGVPAKSSICGASSI